jgi:dienelactone hydrolase
VLSRARLGEVPVLIAHAGSPGAAAARGTVLLYHPLGADKDQHAEDLERLAALGFLAIGVDAIAHGERRVPGAYGRFRADPFGALREVVTATAAEVPELVDRLVARAWAAPGHLGIVGVSLGAFIAYGVARDERRIACAVCVAGSPEWGPDAASPHLSPDRYFPTALLSIHGDGDPLVPPEPGRRFHEALAPFYAAAPERLRRVELPGEGHHMTLAGWGRVRDEANAWLERFVVPSVAPGAHP